MNLYQNSKNVLALSAVAMLFTGCAAALNPVGESSFSCPGMPQGVTCKTPKAVYKSTQGILPNAESDMPMAGTVSQDMTRSAQKKPVKKTTKQTRDADQLIQAKPLKVALPVRTSSQVMRIWVAPWIDKNDDLHVPSFLYTEINARKWNVGDYTFSGNGVNVPHKVVEMAPGANPELPSVKTIQTQQTPGKAPSIEEINLGE